MKTFAPTPSNTSGDETPLTADEFKLLKTGDFVRVVDRAGRIAQGSIVKPEWRGHSSELVVAGLTWNTSSASFYRAADGSPEICPQRVVVTAEEVRDHFADLTVGVQTVEVSRPSAVNMDQIMLRVLGYDPSAGRREKNFGGKSKSAWINEHWATTQNLKAVQSLVDDGVLRLVKVGTYNSPSIDETFVRFPFRTKTGWVLSEQYEAVRVDVAAKERRAVSAKLLAQARATVADRHAAEVQEELTRLLLAQFRLDH
jgi:hypothetical protein